MAKSLDIEITQEDDKFYIKLNGEVIRNKWFKTHMEAEAFLYMMAEQ